MNNKDRIAKLERPQQIVENLEEAYNRKLQVKMRLGNPKDVINVLGIRRPYYEHLYEIRKLAVKRWQSIYAKAVIDYIENEGILESITLK